MASSLARNSVANGIAGFATTLGGVLSTVIIARVLGVEGTGVVAFAVWVVTFALLTAEMGIPSTLTRYVSSTAASGGENTPQGVATSLYTPFAISNAVVAIAFFAYAAWLAFAYSQPFWHIDASNYRTAPLFWALIAAATLAQAFANFTNGYLRGIGEFRKLSTIAVVSATIQVATALIGAWLFGIAGAMTGAVLGFIIPAAMAHNIASPSAAIDPALKQRIMRYAIESWFGFIVAAFAWSRMEIFFLERSFGSEAVGLFTSALTLSNIVTQGPMLLTGALIPFLARQAALDDRDKLRTSYAMVLRLFALAVAPACFGLAAISKTLLPMIFGQSFAPAVPSAMILLIAAAVTYSGSISTLYLLALEKTRVVLLFASLGAVLVVAAGLTIIPAYGPIGAAVSRSLIQLAVVSAGLWYAARYLDAPPPLLSLARIFLAAAGSGLVAYGVSGAIGGVSGIAVAILVAIAAYALLLKVFGALPPDDAAELERTASLLPKPLDAWMRTAIAWIAAHPPAQPLL